MDRLDGLLSAADLAQIEDGAVLNGIAYDARHDRLFVTGKLWPKLFEVEIRPLTAGRSARTPYNSGQHGDS